MESSATTLGAGAQAEWLTSRLPGVSAGLYGFLVVALVAGSAGGYRETTWGWTALATLWLGAVVLVARERVELGALELVVRRRTDVVRRLGGAVEPVDAVGAEHDARGAARPRLHRRRRDGAPRGAREERRAPPRRRALRHRRARRLRPVDPDPAGSARRLRLDLLRLPARSADHVLERPRRYSQSSACCSRSASRPAGDR